jgi:hypothetical protein
MSWFKLDDNFGNHPKVNRAGNAAAGLWVRCGTYCAQYLTDGHIPLEVAGQFGNRKEIEALLDAGLWVQNGDGYVMPDYLEYNPSREETLTKREAERVRKAGGIR